MVIIKLLGSTQISHLSIVYIGDPWIEAVAPFYIFIRYKHLARRKKSKKRKRSKEKEKEEGGKRVRKKRRTKKKRKKRVSKKQNPAVSNPLTHSLPHLPFTYPALHPPPLLSPLSSPPLTAPPLSLVLRTLPCNCNPPGCARFCTSFGATYVDRKIYSCSFSQSSRYPLHLPHKSPPSSRSISVGSRRPK